MGPWCYIPAILLQKHLNLMNVSSVLDVAGLLLWQESNIDALLDEGLIIQQHLHRCSCPATPADSSRTFPMHLVFCGKAIVTLSHGAI